MPTRALRKANVSSSWQRVRLRCGCACPAAAVLHNFVGLRTLPLRPWGSTQPFLFMKRDLPFRFCWMTGSSMDSRPTCAGGGRAPWSGPGLIVAHDQFCARSCTHGLTLLMSTLPPPLATGLTVLRAGLRKQGGKNA